MKRIAIAAVLALIAEGGFADMAGQARAQGVEFTVVGGAGTTSCAEFVQAAEAERRARPPGAGADTVYTRDYLAYAEFADGFLSGINWADSEDHNVGKGSGHPGRMLWLENFCHTNPFSIFVDALIFLHYKLEAQRHGRGVARPHKPRT